MIPIKTLFAVLSLGIAVAILLSGCLGVKTPPLSRPVPPSIFVDYQRSGGFAGVNDRVVIFDNGVTIISNRKASTEITLNSSELERINMVFSGSKFTAFEGNYTSRRGGADLMQYTISYHGTTVHTEDTAIPPGMEPVIEEMNRILTLGAPSAAPGSPLPAIGS